jgi:hypothetical protein
VLRENRELYSTPSMAKQIHAAFQANREVFSAPSIAKQIQDSLRANRELIQRAAAAGVAAADVGALEVPDVEDDSLRVAQWLTGLSTIGRLVVLNATLGLLQALLAQIESAGTEIPDTLQAGIGSIMAVIAAIIVVEGRDA